jgi:TRAP-type C4-dicarboxylate transport system substrate-binding protein
VRKAAGATAIALAGAPAIARGASAKHVLKIATLAPQHSTWMKTLAKVGRDIKAKTHGEVAIRYYPGGVMGDESAMVRKMRHGQLDGAAVTSVGLSDINPQVLMLQLPLLFRTYKELDRVRSGMHARFSKLLADAGFVLMGWGDVGFVHIFSNVPVAKPSDLKDAKVWIWDADRISAEVMRVAGINAVPLGVPDVLPSLQTGVVDTFQTSPYAAVALQWYTKVKYVTDLKIAVSIGGSVLTEKAWNKLDASHRQVIRAIADVEHKVLLEQIRIDNRSAVTTLKKKGLQIVAPKDVASSWMPIAKKTRENLTGTLFDASLVKEMTGYLG